MNLAVLAVHLLFHTHLASSHAHAMCETSCLQERLSTHFHTRKGFDVGSYICLAQVVLNPSCVLFVSLQEAKGSGEIILDSENIGQERMAARKNGVTVYLHGEIVFQD